MARVDLLELRRRLLGPNVPTFYDDPVEISGVRASGFGIWRGSWGRFWDNPALRPQEQGLLLKVRDCLREKLAHLRAEGDDFGLIHADLMRENLLCGPEGLVLIDFDDSGFGFRL